MISYANNEILIEQGLCEKNIYFFQLWKEQLHKKTIDIYRYKVLGSCSACAELIDIIEKYVNGTNRNATNIIDCKNETLSILKSDIIIENNANNLWKQIISVINSIPKEKKNSNYSDKSLNRILNTLNPLLSILKEKYLHFATSTLKESLDNNNYKNVKVCTKLIISHCIYIGWSDEGLYKAIDVLKTKQESAQQWKKFVEVILSEKKEFDIYINNRYKKTEPSILNKVSQSAIKGDKINVNNAQISNESIYFMYTISAYDSYSASRKAYLEHNRYVSTCSYFNMINPQLSERLKGFFIAVDLKNDIVEEIEASKLFKTYALVDLDAKNSIFDDTLAIINEQSKQNILEEIMASFSYINLSKISFYQETKFIMLWIALESIMYTRTRSNIIDHIKYVLPEILCTRYIYRIIRNFSEDCIRCGFNPDYSHIKIDFKEKDKRKLSKRIISCFLDEEEYKSIHDFCKQNNLLLERCEEIKEILDDGETLQNKLNDYTKKIRWHIQRLYRIRNEITHSAFIEKQSLTIYIEHLNTYLLQVINEIIYFAANKKANTVGEALEMITENYKLFVDILKKDNTKSILDLINDGVIELY